MSPVGRSPSRHCNPFWCLLFGEQERAQQHDEHFYKLIEMVGAQIILHFYLIDLIQDQDKSKHLVEDPKKKPQWPLE